MRRGGSLHRAARVQGAPQQGGLDLSTGVNPRPYPNLDRNHFDANLGQLPSEEDLRQLLQTARATYDVRDDTAIVAAPGLETLIRALPHLIEGPVAVADTACRSFDEAWSATERRLARANPAALAGDPTISLIIVNPNDVDGDVTGARDVLGLARSRAGGAVVVVDESYAEAQPGASIVPHLRPGDPVVVLKSFGKFFGLPGLRLGFAIGQPALLRRLSSLCGERPLSRSAVAIGRAALADLAWQAESRHWLGNQAQALDGVLRGGGLALLGGCRLFRVARAADAAALHRRLADGGVSARIFDDRPGLLRFGLPADANGLARLAAALAGA